MNLPHGLFGWVDLSTNDPAAAKDFYRELLGWQVEDIPTPMGPVYTMLRVDGKLVAGLGPQSPDQVAAHAPSAWNSYVIVDDVDAVCAVAAGAAGAAENPVVMPAMDVMDQGRMAMLAAPSGAVVGVWQPARHKGAELFNAPGALTWNELQSRNLEADLAWHAEVFGWRWVDSEHMPQYRIAHLDTKTGDDTSNGGAMVMPPQLPAEVASFWHVYFAVDDAQATHARALELGAHSAYGPMDVGGGTMAGLVDPTGAMLSVSSFPHG